MIPLWCRIEDERDKTSPALRTRNMFTGPGLWDFSRFPLSFNQIMFTKCKTETKWTNSLAVSEWGQVTWRILHGALILWRNFLNRNRSPWQLKRIIDGNVQQCGQLTSGAERASNNVVQIFHSVVFSTMNIYSRLKVVLNAEIYSPISELMDVDYKSVSISNQHFNRAVLNSIGDFFFYK